MGRVGQVTEVEEAGVIVQASSLFEDGERVVRKRKIRELLTTTDLVRLRYTSPPVRLDTMTIESEGVVSGDHDELAQRRSWNGGSDDDGAGLMASQNQTQHISRRFAQRHASARSHLT